MRPAADGRNAVSEQPRKLDALQPRLSASDWTGEPATEDQLNGLRRLGYQPLRPLSRGKALDLIRGFEEHQQIEEASAENGVREITKRRLKVRTAESAGLDASSAR